VVSSSRYRARRRHCYCNPRWARERDQSFLRKLHKELAGLRSHQVFCLCNYPPMKSFLQLCKCTSALFSCSISLQLQSIYPLPLPSYKIRRVPPKEYQLVAPAQSKNHLHCISVSAIGTGCRL
jgi:hypothetical protein